MTINELRNKLLRKEFSVTELTKHTLDVIKKKDKEYGAFITLCEESAIREATSVDNNGIGNSDSILCGIPFAVKDNLCTKDIPTTCASKILENFVPCYDATSVAHIKNNGGIVIGKTNMDEFGMGNTTSNSAFHKTANPVNTGYFPGGSSGGSAAAVSASFVSFALGTDTGGSVRQPASHCGVYGFCPTYGTVSRFGLIAFASSLDRVGVIAKNSNDCAEVYSTIIGKDKKDSTTKDIAFDRLNFKQTKQLRVAIPENTLEYITNPMVRTTLDKAAKSFESIGACVEYVSMQSIKYALPAYYIISSAEASSNLARYDGIRYGTRAKNYKNLEEMYLKTRSEGFGDEVKRRILLGTFSLSVGYSDKYYKKAVAARQLIKDEYRKTFENYDIILSPVAPDTARKITNKRCTPLDSYKDDIFTVPSSLAGLPSISVPFGVSSDGLPIGVQLIAAEFNENTLFYAAKVLETDMKGAE